MTDHLTPEQERDSALNDLARLRAGLSAGLSAEQSERLRGSTPEELAADAAEFAAMLPAAPAAPSGMRVGGARGVDVPGTGPGTMAAGVAAYRARHGLGEDGKPERTPWPVDGRSAFDERTYSMERGNN